MNEISIIVSTGIGHKGQAVSLTCVLAQDIFKDDNGYDSHKDSRFSSTYIFFRSILKTIPTC